MKPWLLLPTLSAPMPLQMAMDEILFREMEKNQISDSPILRFYHASEPWVTVGYSQKVQDYALDSKTASVCRRITGGGVVKHGEDLIFSVTAKNQHHEAFHSVRISYLKIHEAVKQAYEQLGCLPRFFRCDEKLQKGKDCFAFPIATDLGIGGSKVAGGAQKRSAATLLHQESVRIPQGIDMDALRAQIHAGFEQVFSVSIEAAVLDPDILSRAKRLADEKYKER